MDARIRAAIGSGECVIDLGCGSGEMLAGLGDQFEERIGLDVTRNRRKVMNEGAVGEWVFVEADLNRRIPLKDEMADAVVANQVIEHIIDPGCFVSEIYRVLKPGGRCVVSTPNIRYLKNIGHLLFSGYGPRTAGGNKTDGAWDDGHIHYFTHKDLRELFGEAGFRDIDSCALVDLSSRNWIRYWIDRHPKWSVFREFLSGNILLWGVK